MQLTLESRARPAAEFPQLALSLLTCRMYPNFSRKMALCCFRTLSHLFLCDPGSKIISEAIFDLISMKRPTRGEVSL